MKGKSYYKEEAWGKESLEKAKPSQPSSLSLPPPPLPPQTYFPSPGPPPAPPSSPTPTTNLLPPTYPSNPTPTSSPPPHPQPPFFLPPPPHAPVIQYIYIIYYCSVKSKIQMAVLSYAKGALYKDLIFVFRIHIFRHLHKIFYIKTKILAIVQKVRFKHEQCRQ